MKQQFVITVIALTDWLIFFHWLMYRVRTVWRDELEVLALKESVEEGWVMLICSNIPVYNLVKYIGVGTVVELMRILHTSNSQERKCVVMNNIMCVIYCVIEHIISK